MKRDDRRQAILDLLIVNGAVDLDDLVKHFAVSKMTIHRDFDDLEQLGMLRKIRGGATIEPGTQFESDFRFRELKGAPAKEAISKAALDLIKPGMSVIINDGSTAAVLGQNLIERRPLTVITNNDAVILALKERSGADLIALGGGYSGKYNAYFGKVTEDALTTMRADIAFISSPAVYGTDVFHMDEAVVRTKRAMMAAASKRCLLVNHARFGHQALHKFAELSEFDHIITDGRPSDEAMAALSKADIPLTIAAPLETAEKSHATA